jgi:sugar porter (SP) family MFS transporter
VARFIGGIAIGIASLLAPLYIAEISPESIRGRLVSLNQFAIVLGILLSYLTGWGLAFLGAGSWRWMFASMAIPSFLFLVALFPVPESPRWLVSAGQTADAEQVLKKLGDDPKRVEEVRVALAEEAGAKLMQRRLRKPLAIGMLLAIFQQVTGINTILYYGSVIFTEHARSGNTSAALWANVLIGLINLVFTVVALFTIDKAGRKALLMLASAGMGVSLAILCVLFSMPAPNHAAILGCILSYVAFFAVGLGPGVWVVISELFPTNVRGRAMSVSTVTLWSACLLITSTFLSLVNAITIQGAFGLYAVLCLCTCLFVWRVVPETKGQTLEAIERQWMVRK